MLQLIRFLKGYVRIRLSGYSPERFINLCGNHNILLWDIQNHGSFYTMSVSLKAFRQLKKITRKTGTRVVITKRCGLPFLMVKVQKRKIFLSGIILSLLFWILMSGYIWNIRITGNHYVTEEVLMDFLSENNIKTGMKKKQLAMEDVEKKIRNEFPVVTWTSARMDGTSLVIQIRENEKLPEIKEGEEGTPDEGYDLVADRDGTIVGMITRSGCPVVKEGDMVQKGDILVEGCVPIMNENGEVKRYEYCRADADVRLSFSFDREWKFPEKYEYRTYTGREKKGLWMLVGKRVFHLGLPGKAYREGDCIMETEQMRLFGNFLIPFYLISEKNREYVTEERIYEQAEIRKQMEHKIQKFVETLEEKGVQNIKKDVTIKKYKGIYALIVEFEVTAPCSGLQKTEIRMTGEVQGE